MFGKNKSKKKEEVAEVETPEEETPDLEVSPEELNSGNEELEETKRKLAEAEEKLKETKKVKSEPKQEVKAKAEARIITGELIGEGLYKYVVVSNKIIGEIGEKFPLD